jgi:2-dehydro-3-deoxygalactonokinase
MYYLAVDSGTTNSRVWLMQDRQVVEKKQIFVGVRNTAIDGHNRALLEGIRQAILELKTMTAPGKGPEFALAAGMITSNLGLAEVQHVQAPAGIEELSARVEKRTFCEMDDLPFYFVPGVRSGPRHADLSNVNDIDIVRGEETEVMGALREFALSGPLLYIHLGSHTKLVKVDGENRICGGSSTLGGELNYAVRQETILRDSLPHVLGPSIQEEFLEQGWSYCRKFGLYRTLYLVRIFGLNSRYPKESIASFFLGASISEEFRCLEPLMAEEPASRVLLSGLPQLHPAWHFFLKPYKWAVRSLSPDETEQAFLRGLYEFFWIAQKRAGNDSLSLE